MISKNPYTIIQVKRIRVGKSCRKKENFIKLATTNNDETFFCHVDKLFKNFVSLAKYIFTLLISTVPSLQQISWIQK